jgi:hypothetical protein
LAAAQLTIASKVLWAKATVNHVCDALTISGNQQAKGLVIEDARHAVLLLYEVFQI